MTYKKVKFGTVELDLIRRSDGSYIPKDEKNKDYKEFLDSGASLEEAE